MATKIPVEFTKVFSKLWALPAGMDLNAVTEASAFTALCAFSNDHCYARIECFFDKVSLALGLQKLGIPCFFEAGSKLANSDIKQAEEQCYLALMQQCENVLYLCPLDWAGDIPCITFENAEIKIYNPGELDTLLNTATVRRQPGYSSVDTSKLAEFTWLVVEGSVELAPKFQARYYPGLEMDRTKSLSLYPYKHHYPKDVEKVLFLLMLAPWETWTDDYVYNWRPFYIPWVHTLHSDIFERQWSIMDANTLSWCPDYRTNSEGELVELECPCERISHVTANDLTPFVSETMRINIMTAINNGLINIAARHQFIKAFMSSGIDEFLAHIIVIDACMGGEHEEENAIKNPIFENIKDTPRMQYRLAGLLGEKSVKNELKRLYRFRSNWVHGNNIAKIDRKAHIQARSLARRMLITIIQLAAQKPRLTRKDFLYETLEKGWKLIEGK